MWLKSYFLWDCTQRHHMQRNNIQKAQKIIQKHSNKLRYYLLCFVLKLKNAFQHAFSFFYSFLYWINYLNNVVEIIRSVRLHATASYATEQHSKNTKKFKNVWTNWGIVYCVLCLNWKSFSMRFHFLCFFILNKLFEQRGWTRTYCEIARSGITCNRTTFKKHIFFSKTFK